LRRLKARVLLKSGYLSAQEVRAAHLEPVDDIQGAIDEATSRHGDGARVCVLPQGPQTIAYVEED
jgi:hypothetical protein